MSTDKFSSMLCLILCQYAPNVLIEVVNIIIVIWATLLNLRFLLLITTKKVDVNISGLQNLPTSGSHKTGLNKTVIFFGISSCPLYYSAFSMTCKKYETHLGIPYLNFCKLVILSPDLFSNLTFSFFIISLYHDHCIGTAETWGNFSVLPSPSGLAILICTWIKVLRA